MVKTLNTSSCCIFLMSLRLGRYRVTYYSHCYQRNEIMGSAQPSKFERFDRADYIYSTVQDHEISTSVFTPKEIADGQGHNNAPVMIYWHGGGFIVGDRLYEPWWPIWLLQYALSRKAMIIAPDYRLLPEATGADIMDDMRTFWTWMIDTLPGIAKLESWTAQPDMDHILCVGHSAGGLIALQSALQHPDIGISAVLSLYGPLDNNSPELKMARPRKILGSMPPPPRQAELIIRNYVQRNRGMVRTGGNVMEMWELVTCILQQGRLPRMFHSRADPRLDTLETIVKVKQCPPIWVVHGDCDSVVSIDRL